MRYSKIGTKTSKTVKDYDSVNARLLLQAGFIDQVMAGSYTFLPLGLRTLNKIETIIREEMDKIGREVLMPSLVPQELWRKTGRLDNVDVLMSTKGANAKAIAKNSDSYILSPTHEEVVTPIAAKFAQSYRDLPCAYYQINVKFRNEPRAKSGLLRGREFRMKDLYSFHRNEADLKRYYHEDAINAYWRVYERLGLKEHTLLVAASGGDFTDDFSHEFQTICDTGEDIIFWDTQTGDAFNKEVAPSTAPRLDHSHLKELPMREIEGAGIIGVEELARYLKISVEDTTKTILFETETGEVIAAAVRGGYEINEEKLRKIVGCKTLTLASPSLVEKVTGAQVGYAGLLNLPRDVRVFMDDSMQGRKNFEMGANRTNYHVVNVNFGRDIPEPEKFYDIKIAREGDIYPKTGTPYTVVRAAEVGNIFPLYTRFPDAFGYTYQDEDGKQQKVYMGCYGIGPTRIMGVLVEKFHDDRGIIWPESVAPYRYHLIGLDLQDEQVAKQAQFVYETLSKKYPGEVLFDDRLEARAGEKFTDCDLIGCPTRVVVSRKTGEKVEVKKRTERETRIVELSNI
jgi:prolyl-tRNA synthetase